MDFMFLFCVCPLRTFSLLIHNRVDRFARHNFSQFANTNPGSFVVTSTHLRVESYLDKIVVFISALSSTLSANYFQAYL